MKLKTNYLFFKPRLQTAITETRARSRKPLRTVTYHREEDDCLFFKIKKILNTGMLLTLQQPAYVRGLSKGRAHMYACRPTIVHVHLCNFSKK
jgi:hypothetical protein